MPRPLKQEQRAYVMSVFLDLERKFPKLNQTQLGKLAGTTQSRWSKIKQNGETSMEVLIQAAEAAGRAPEEIDRISGRRKRGPWAEVSPSDPPVGTLLIGLSRTPGLERWCVANPGAVRVSQVMRAIESFAAEPPLSHARDGGPVDGWASYFAAIEAGHIGAPSAAKGTGQEAEELERLEHPDLPSSNAARSRAAKPPKKKPRKKK